MPDPADSTGLVLDASPWINLLATEAMESILGALGVPCYAPEQVVAEVKRHPTTRVTFSAEHHPLRKMSPSTSILSLEGEELDLFFEIVSASASDALGDGEAAAIAVAASRGLDLVVDDRKARRILREHFGRIRTYWTMDLLHSRSVVVGLGQDVVDECVERAVRFGRMHVPRT